MLLRWRLAAQLVLLLWAGAAANAAALAPGRAARALGRAEALALRGRTERAIEALRGLLDTNPDYAEAHLLYIDLRSESARAVVRSEYEHKLEASPQSPLLHFLVGYATDDVAERLRLYRRAVALGPDLFHAQLELGKLCRGEAVDDLASSLRALEAAVALRPRSAEAHRERARSLEAAGRVIEAIASLRRAVELDPRSEQAWLALARLARGSAGASPPEASGEAEQLLQRAVGACPRSGRLWWALADLLWRDGRFRDAERPLEKALRYANGADYAPEATDRLAAWYLMNGYVRSARRLSPCSWDEAIAEMADGRLSAEAFRIVHLARRSSLAGRLAALERVQGLAPDSAFAAEAFASALAEAGDHGRAAELYAKVAALRPADPSALERAAACFLLAGRPAEAARVLREGRKPLSREATWLLADAEAMAAGDLTVEAFAARHAAGRSRDALRAVIEQFPSYLTPRIQLAWLLREAGQGVEAAKALRAAEAVSGHPLVEADRHALLGELALADKYLAKAIEHCRKAAELAPRVARHRGALARACVERGELGSAREALERQLELDPAAYDLPDSADEGGEGYRLEPRLEPGDVLRYRYATDGGQPGLDPAELVFDYVIEAVQPGGLVEATLEVVEVTGRLVEGGRELEGARLAVTCSSAFGLVDVARRRVPDEFAQLRWLVQFLHGPALPVERRPGQRWREPAWTVLGRLYGGAVRFERVRRGRAVLSKVLEYEKRAGERAVYFEVMAVRGRAEVTFGLDRRVVERAEVTTHVTLTRDDGSKAILPPSVHRLELLEVRRGAREVGQRRVLAGVPYIRQVGPKCAAAALAMVFRHAGREVDQEELFQELKGRGGGVHVHMLPAAARRHGFDARTYTGDLADLRRKIDAGIPVILFLTPMGMGHAVVAVGYDSRRREVILHDPAVAPLRRMAFDQLDREWGESGRSCVVVAPRGDPRFARLTCRNEQAVEAMLEGDRALLERRLEHAEQAYRRSLELFPGYAEAWLALARTLVAQKRLGEALGEIDRLVAERPECLAARIAKADVLLLQRRHEEAIALARDVELQDPHNLRNLNVLATAYLQSQRREKAIAVLERAVRYAPAWVNVRFRLAALYYLSGRYDSAAEQYRAALDHEPRNTAAHYLLASTLLQSLRDDRRHELPWPVRREHARAIIAHLESLRALEGPSCETSAELAHLYDLLGNGPRHIELLRRSVREMTLHQLRQQQDTPSDADPFSFLGQVSGALRRVVERAYAFARAQRERATNLNNLAWAFAIRGQNLDEALRLAQQSVALRTAGFNLDTLAWVQYQLGQVEAARARFLRAAALQDDPVIHIHLALTYLKLGERGKADEQLRKAFDLGEPAVQVHLEHADACLQAGLRERELAALEAAVAADPRHRRARYRLAMALLERERDLPRALALAEALHAADPDDPLYRGVLGAACQGTGNRRKARRLLERAVEGDPLLGPEPVAPFRYFLALNLLEDGDREEAVAQLQAYLDIQPDGAFAGKARALLRQ